MLKASINTQNNMFSPARQIQSKVELYKSSTETAKGETIVLNDAIPQTVDIKVSSKNLLNSKKVASSGNIWFGVDSYNDSLTLAAGTYTFSVVTADGKKTAVYAQNGTTNSNISVNWDGLSVTFTLTEETPVKLKVYKSSYTIDSVVSAQLEYGEIATQHTPYITDFEFIEVNIDDTVWNVWENGVLADIYISKGSTIFSITSGVYVSVEYKALNLQDTYTYKDYLKSFTVDRAGEKNKFFGFTICQKATINLRDKERVINPTAANCFKLYLASAEDEYIGFTPLLYIDEIKRDENTNDLTITCYDAIKTAEKYTVNDLGLVYPTVAEYGSGVAAQLGCSQLVAKNMVNAAELFNIGSGANYDGTENLREVLADLAEFTQSICYIDAEDRLILKRLNKPATEDLIITKAEYFTLDSKEACILETITHTNELGDSLTATTGKEGSTQIIRSNAFYDFAEDLADLLDDAIALMGGLVITPFNCSWRGNFLLEIGDKIALVTKDDNLIYSYVLNDTISYNGGLSQKSSWGYDTANDGKIAKNPTTLGEAIKETFAKVDKVNKQIDMVVSETTTNTEMINAIQITTEGINSSVSRLEEKANAADESLSSLKQQVEMQLTETDVAIKVREEIANGVETVTTGKGYTFNNEGLTIEDINENNNNIKTTVSNNGMVVFSNNDEVLKANDEGVKAVDLHATTFLIIGNTSRLEDFGGKTACFWIGGNN